MRPTLLMVVLALVSGAACADDKWEAFVYPNRFDLTSHVNAGEHKSLEACRSAARSTLAQLGAEGVGDYECGLNCKQKAGFEGKVCKKTER